MADVWSGLKLAFEVPMSPRRLSVRLETTSERVAIVGPSGAGKSTVLRVLAGLERRAVGTVEVDGEIWLHSERHESVPPWKRRVGWVPQEVSLFPHLSVQENLAYAGAPAEEMREIADLLEVTDLLARRPRWLSGGERQRVALGRAMLSNPRILLLDEPFSALDRPLRLRLSEMLSEWARSNRVPILLVSHDEEDTRLLTKERWRMVDGRLELNPRPRDDLPSG